MPTEAQATPNQNPDPTPFTQIFADIKRNAAAADELGTSGAPDAVVQSIKDIWAFLEGSFETCDEILRDHGEAISELIEEEGEVLEPETGSKIIETLALGGKIALITKKLISDAKDNSARARKILALIDDYAKATADLVPHIQEITREEEPDDPAEVEEVEPDDDDDDEGEEDDEEDDK